MNKYLKPKNFIKPYSFYKEKQKFILYFKHNF
jgi:hypothetical protein